MRFQIPSQASLHGIVKLHRSLASRAALLSRLARDKEIAKNWHPEKIRGTPGLPGWQGF